MKTNDPEKWREEFMDCGDLRLLTRIESQPCRDGRTGKGTRRIGLALAYETNVNFDIGQPHDLWVLSVHDIPRPFTPKRIVKRATIRTEVVQERIVYNLATAPAPAWVDLSAAVRTIAPFIPILCQVRDYGQVLDAHKPDGPNQDFYPQLDTSPAAEHARAKACQALQAS